MPWKLIGVLELWLLIPNLWSGWVGGGDWLTLCPGRFVPVKEHRYPLMRRLDGTQRWSGRFAEEKSLASTWIQTPNPLEIVMFVVFCSTKFNLKKSGRMAVGLFRCVCGIAKSIYSFVVSVRPFLWNNSALTGWIFIKFDIWVFVEKQSRKFKFH